jgi:two-component system sensor histidine kinase/response regulator
MKKQSLKIKLMAVVGASIIGLIAALGIILGWAYSLDQQKKLENSLSQEVQIVSYAASAGLEFNDTRTVEDAVGLLKNIKEFVDVKVLGQDGKIFLRKEFHRSGKDLRSNSFTVAIPVLNNVNLKIGQIQAVVTEQYFRDDIKRILGIALIFTFGVVAFVLFMVVLILRKLFSPLTRLKETIDKVSGEGFIGQVVVESHDEVGQLAASFNEMSRRIEERTEMLREAKQKADASSQAKSQFLANMSHETRTPLNAILGFCDMLSSTAVDEKQREYLNTITSSGNILLSIINDVLDFSKLEAGSVQLESIDFDLGNLVNDVFNIAQIRFEDSRVDPYIDWDARVPQWVKGDPTRIRQVLLNFLNNAAKFTKKGSIGVILRLDHQTPKGPVVRFCVKDTGIGIPEDKKHFLFEPFSQVDSSTTRRYGGAGLGLVISKKLVDAMEGKVWFESCEGQGSQFFFTIPFATGASLIQQPIAPLTKEQLINKTVLCVDDYKGSLEVVSRYCEEMGLKVMRASNAAEALQKLNELSASGMVPDLMLSDVRMPDMDGYAMVEKIRTNPKFDHMKIVATTSDSRIGAAHFAQGKGFNAYLPKPVIRRDLIKVISTVLGDKRLASAPIITRHLANEVSLKGIKVLVVDDVPSNQQLMKAYLNMFGCVSDFASNGQEAVDKLKAGSYDICLMDIQMPRIKRHRSDQDHSSRNQQKSSDYCFNGRRYERRLGSSKGLRHE